MPQGRSDSFGRAVHEQCGLRDSTANCFSGEHGNQTCNEWKVPDFAAHAMNKVKCVLIKHYSRDKAIGVDHVEVDTIKRVAGIK